MTPVGNLMQIVPTIIKWLVLVLPLILFLLLSGGIKKQLNAMDTKYKTMNIHLKVANYELASQKKKLARIENDIEDITKQLQQNRDKDIG